MQSLLTVVIPTKDRPGHLSQAVSSVIQQGPDSPAIIVVDDGSEVTASQQLKDITQAHLRYIRNDMSLGASAARNRGVAAADTEWVLFLDDDDWLSPDYIVSLSQLIKKSDSAVDFFWPVRMLVHEKGARVMKKPAIGAGGTSTLAAERGLAGVLDTGCSGMAFRRATFMASGGFDETLRMSEDRDLVFRLLAAGHRGQPSLKSGLFVRVHDGPRLSSQSNSRAQADSDLRVLDRHRAFLAQHPVLAERFIGRAAGRLWQNGFYEDALAVINALCRIQPCSLRARKRQVLWSIMLWFKFK